MGAKFVDRNDRDQIARDGSLAHRTSNWLFERIGTNFSFGFDRSSKFINAWPAT